MFNLKLTTLTIDIVVELTKSFVSSELLVSSEPLRNGKLKIGKIIARRAKIIKVNQIIIDFDRYSLASDFWIWCCHVINLTVWRYGVWHGKIINWIAWFEIQVLNGAIWDCIEWMNEPFVKTITTATITSVTVTLLNNKQLT